MVANAVGLFCHQFSACWIKRNCVHICLRFRSALLLYHVTSFAHSRSVLLHFYLCLSIPNRFVSLSFLHVRIHIYTSHIYTTNRWVNNGLLMVILEYTTHINFSDNNHSIICFSFFCSICAHTNTNTYTYTCTHTYELVCCVAWMGWDSISVAFFTRYSFGVCVSFVYSFSLFLSLFLPVFHSSFFTPLRFCFCFFSTFWIYLFIFALYFSFSCSWIQSSQCGRLCACVYVICICIHAWMDKYMVVYCFVVLSYSIFFSLFFSSVNFSHPIA